jgi:sodium pump decarboxylase gamma subunit
MSNVAWGLQITVVGMGLVFGLLALLYGLLYLVLRLDGPPPRVVPVPTGEAVEDKAEQPEPAPAPGATAQATDGMDADLLAAITIAVLTHTTHGRRAAVPAMRTFWPGSQLHASRWVASGRMRQNQSWTRKG